MFDTGNIYLRLRYDNNIVERTYFNVIIYVNEFNFYLLNSSSSCDIVNLTINFNSIIMYATGAIESSSKSRYKFNSTNNSKIVSYLYFQCSDEVNKVDISASHIVSKNENSNLEGMHTILDFEIIPMNKRVDELYELLNTFFNSESNSSFPTVSWNSSVSLDIENTTNFSNRTKAERMNSI